MKRKSTLINLFLAVILTACGNTNSGNESPKIEDLRPQISQQDFDAALSKLEFTVDEFDGSWEIFYLPNWDMGIIKASGPRDSRFSLDISLYILREKSDSPLDARVKISFLGTECMNVNQWDTKSSTGVVNFDFESNLSDCKYADPNYPGVVLDEANKYMNQTEMLDYCEIINGKEITLRIKGSGAILSHTGIIPKALESSHKNICIVYQGLMDGLSPKMKKH